MKLNFTSGLVLVLISIFVAPVAVLSYRALNSPPEPSTAPTTQIRMLASPLARIPYLPPTSNSISGKPNKPTPTPATVDWGDVTNKPAGFADNLDNDALGGLNCDTAQLARWNGSAWECFSLATLEEQIAALMALHPTPTPTPIPIPPRDLIFDQPVAISGSAGITGWRSSAVVDGQGTVHVVWISTPTPSSIMYTSKPAGGVWSQPFNLSGATLGVLRQDLAVSPDGTIHVVWRQFEEVDGRGFDSVFYSSKSPSGGWTPPQDIDQSDLDVDNPPLIAVDGSGRVHVVWQDNYTTSSGAGWSTPVKIGDSFRDTRDLTAETNGTLHLLSKKSEVLYHTIRDGADDFP